MSIKLALEMPPALFKVLEMNTDLDFILAHKVLEDSYYADHFANRPKSRELILDNSMHELGTPLPIGDLIAAAKKVRPTWVIAPDNMDDVSWTIARFYEMKDRFPGGHGAVVGVVVGQTPHERAQAYDHFKSASLVCLPFRRPRLEWFLEQKMRHPRIHLLGMSSDWELEAWTWLSFILPDIEFSVDTSKPLKAGLLGLRIHSGMPLRGLGVSSKDLLEIKYVSPSQIELIRANVNWLRTILAGVGSNVRPA